MRTKLFYCLLFLGTFLRFHALERQSIWNDEMATVETISTPARQVIHRFASYEMHPPLYFLQLRLWRALHFNSLVKLRANSALWGSLGLLLMYLLGKRYGGPPLGLLSLAFLAFSPYHLAYSQELRPYAMAVTIGLASLLLLERRSWIALGIFWTAQLYTHYWGIFVVAAQALYGLRSLSTREEKKSLLSCAAAAGGVFALWLPVVIAQWDVIDQLNTWVPPFSFMGLGNVFLAYSGIVFNMASSVFYLPARVWVLVLAGFFFATVLWQGLRAGPRAAAWWLGVGLAIPWMLSYWKPTMFVWYRYPILMLPAFILLSAAGVLIFSTPALRLGLVGVCLGCHLWGDWLYFHLWQKANPKAVVAYVHRLQSPSTIVIRPVDFGTLFNFYDQGKTTVLDEQVLDSPEKREALKGQNFILITYDVSSDPIGDALLEAYKPDSARYFPGTAHLGITVYDFKG